MRCTGSQISRNKSPLIITHIWNDLKYFSEKCKNILIFTFRLQNYVREQILQAVAVMFKHGTVDKRHTNQDTLFTDITQLISSGNLSMVTL